MIEYIKIGNTYIEYDEVYNYYKPVVYQHDINHSDVYILNAEQPLGTLTFPKLEDKIIGHILGKTSSHYIVLCIDKSTIENTPLRTHQGILYLKRYSIHEIKDDTITWNYTRDNLNYIDTLCD